MRQSGHWGFVNPSGKMVINPQFDEAASFTNTLAQVKVGGRTGYIDASGKYVESGQVTGAMSATFS